MYKPKQTIPSLVTSFNREGKVDLDGLIKNLAFQKEAGIECVCVLGGTGEAASLSRDERQQIMETVMRNHQDLKIIFGALVGTIEDIKADIQIAKENDAQAVMVMVPPFVGPSQYDMEKYFKDLAQLDMPLIIFNSPKRSSFNMSLDLINTLSKNEKVIGIKESSGDIYFLQDIIKENKDNFEVLVGGDDLYLPSLVVGATGGILASAAVIPEVLVALDEAVKEENYTVARRLHYYVKELNDEMYKASHPAPLKYLLEYRGLPVGDCRPPFRPLREKYKHSLEKVLERIIEDLKLEVEFIDLKV